MPIYHLKNEQEQVIEKVCSWEALQEWLEENPGWTQMLSAPRIVSGVGSTVVSKTDDGWKDTLRKIKAGSGKGNTINI